MSVRPTYVLAFLSASLTCFKSKSSPRGHFPQFLFFHWTMVTTRTFQTASKFGRFKVLLDFFQRLAFGFRQEERRGNKGNHCAACPEEEHRGIPKVTNRRQEHSGDAGPDGLIQHQREAHAGRTDASRHQLGKSEPGDKRCGRGGRRHCRALPL